MVCHYLKGFESLNTIGVLIIDQYVVPFKLKSIPHWSFIISLLLSQRWTPVRDMKRLGFNHWIKIQHHFIQTSPNIPKTNPLIIALIALQHFNFQSIFTNVHPFSPIFNGCSPIFNRFSRIFNGFSPIPAFSSRGTHGSPVARCSDQADDDEKRRRGAKRSLKALREQFPAPWRNMGKYGQKHEQNAGGVSFFLFFLFFPWFW